LIPFVDPLTEEGFEVWMIDAPAHGESEGPALVLPQKAALLRAAGQRLGGIHAMVAHSFGAAAAALASRDSAVADRLALIAPPGDMLFFTRAFAQALGFSPRVHDLMIDGFERRHAMAFESLRADAVEMAQPTPTLIVHDRSDESVPFDHSELLHSAWVGTRLLRTDGLGHKGVLSDPGVVAEVVRFVSN
jgi:pimeloyl-ACP methyl ester carboxylesterase